MSFNTFRFIVLFYLSTLWSSQNFITNGECLILKKGIWRNKILSTLGFWVPWTCKRTLLQHYQLASNFNHSKITSNGSYSKRKNGNPSYYVCVMIFQKYKGTILKHCLHPFVVHIIVFASVCRSLLQVLGPTTRMNYLILWINNQRCGQQLTFRIIQLPIVGRLKTLQKSGPWVGKGFDKCNKISSQ